MNVELHELSGSNEAIIGTWKEQWKRQGLLVQGKGSRGLMLTQKAYDLLDEIEELDRIWSAYFDKRNRLIKRLGTTHREETIDTDLQRQNPRYEERDSNTSTRRFSRNT